MEFEILLPLALIIIISKLIGIWFEKIGLPQVLGMIIAGLLVGLIQLIGGQTVLTEFTSGGLKFFGKIGIILIMFSSGLETDISKVKQTGKSAIVITALGVAVPLIFGFILSSLFFGFENVYGNIFYGVILTATSVSVTVATLKELGKLNSKIGTAIISAAIIDDIIGIILLSLIISLDGTSEIGSKPLWLVILLMAVFFAAIILIGKFVRKFFNFEEKKHPHTRRIPLFAFAICFFFSFAAEKWFGVADITAAYLTGLMLSGQSDTHYIDRKTDILSYMLFGPIFFANIGINTVSEIISGNFNITPIFLIFGICYVILGLLGKFVGCGIGARISGFNSKDSLRAGVGMMVRAEVVLICTQRGLDSGLVSNAIVPFVLAIIVISSIITPLVLKSSYKGELPLKPAQQSK